MARYPVGANGRLITVIVGDELPPETVEEADCPPAGGDQIWVNGKWTWPVQMVKERRIAEVARRYDAALFTGMAYQGMVLQIREPDQQNIAAVGQEARWAKLGGTGWPEDFAWRMADNSYLPLPSPDDMIALGIAAKAEVFRLRQVKWGHADAIAALETAEAIEAYDIEAGW